MSYWRFENTYDDLRDCYANMKKKPSKDEIYFRAKLIKLCEKIYKEYGEK